MNSVDINSTINSLNSIEEEVSRALTCSLNEIKFNPLEEKEIIELWTKHISHISDFLFLECERTGNKNVYKKLVKNFIFKKSKF